MSQPSLFTRQFWILCISSVLFMASFGMLLPELPEFLDRMGGQEYIGLIVGLFTLAAFFSRFFSGRLADQNGRIKVMVIGTIVTVVAGVGYLLIWSIPAFLVLRFFHGLSTGFRPTGSTAYLTDVAHPSRRGEALGILGVAGSTGMALGPVLGSVLRVEWGYEYMFIGSTALGLISLWLTLLLKETLPNPRPIKLADLNIFKGQVVDFSSWPSSLYLLPVAFTFGVFLTVSPDYVASLGFVYKGSFNAIIVVSSILVRLFAGKASDKYGRIPLLIIGGLFLMIGMAVIAMAQDAFTVSLGGILYGISVGFNMPTVFAWTADLSKPGKVGLALATMLMALEIGIGLGAVVSGHIYSGNVNLIPFDYWLCVFAGGLGVLFLLIYRSRFEKPSVNEF